MTDELRPRTILVLRAGAIFTGGLVWYAWERVWIWRADKTGHQPDQGALQNRPEDLRVLPEP